MTDDLDIPVVDKSLGFDAAKYDGYKTRIARVEKLEVDDFYPEGNFTQTPTTKKWIIEISTEPLHELDENGNITNKLVEYLDDKGEVKHIIVKQKFNLQEVTENGIKKVVISRHPKAALWKFMRSKGVEKVKDLINKNILLKTIPSLTPGDDRKFLRIVI